MPRLRVVVLIAVALTFACETFARDNGPKWIRISSAHFAVLTDANEKAGKEALLRLEQMRAAFGLLLTKPKLILPAPLDVIAFQTRVGYAQNAPSSGGQPISTSGFFLPGDDRNYIVLDLSDPESWRAVTRQFAGLYLRFNYPPAQAWFDEGITSYYSSIHLTDSHEEIGGDPSSFVELLSSKSWLPLTELFSEPANSARTHSALFKAESWIVMHYLIDQGKLPETGTYFALALNRKLPADEAIQQAFGVSADQFQESVKSYFHSVSSALRAPSAPQPGAPSTGASAVQQLGAPLTPAEVGSSFVDIPISDAVALVAEMAARLPEHRDEEVKRLEGLVEQVETESSIAHRALAWVHLQRHEFTEATEELAKGIEVDHKDVWIRYYNALVKFEAARAYAAPTEGLPNMMQDLRAVLDWSPDFAEAHNMLALAQLEGGGLHAAADTMHVAIQLNPRDQSYLLNMAHIYIAQKKWDDATALLERLKDSPDSQVAGTARGDLSDLPTLKKYGILPLRKGEAAKPAESAKAEEGDEEHAAPAAVETGPDRRKVQYLHGKLLSVDCSQPPAATLKVSAGAQILRLRTADYKSLLLIGADEFSCEWRGVSVVVNYKAGEKGAGDLVSLEFR